ncbi:Methylmalonyl-CoA epimerase, mitochondrial [Halotydeus destructor]|nr:Methylmalonyl-CoA epimerase, mitochondrial [Halotydeus destructor]
MLINFARPLSELLVLSSSNILRTQKFSQTRTWNILKVNHVAIATPNIKDAASLYSDVLGLNVLQNKSLVEHGVNVVILDAKNTHVELLDNQGMTNSPISSYLKKNAAGGIHHICFEVDNLELAVRDLKEKEIQLLSDDSRIGANGKPVIFLHPKHCNGVLIEFQQV